MLRRTSRSSRPWCLREITYRVLTGPQGSRLRELSVAGAPAQRVAKSIRWLKEHLNEPARIETLAKRAGMSPSAFHLHFKGVTALSPLQYQKRLRLQEARRLMVSEGLNATEAGIASGTRVRRSTAATTRVSLVPRRVRTLPR
jgi:AraC-like DNA-binding protein